MKKRVKKWMIGIDEVGRGPLAGPVVVCACIIPDNFSIKLIFKDGIIRDSKKVKKENRYEVYKIIKSLRKLKIIDYSVSKKSAKYIDSHGISNSIKFCVKEVLEDLEFKFGSLNNIKILLDGSLIAPSKYFDQKTIIKGDEKELSIAIASIIAKCNRDTYMKNLSKKFKNYGWENNFGYGTKKHIEAIKKFGIKLYHRKSYIK